MVPPVVAAPSFRLRRPRFADPVSAVTVQQDQRVKRERYRIDGAGPVAHSGQAPLDLFGAEAARIDRRAVNLRWLCASSLTG